MARPNKKSNIETPSFFWENFLEEKYESYAGNDLKKGQSAADQVRHMIERFNERIVAVRNNPTANDPEKRLQIEKIAKQMKQKIEDHINAEGRILFKIQADLNSIIDQDISEANGGFAKETREKLDRMSETEKISFIRRLQKGGDWESVKHLLSRTSVYLGLDAAEYTEIKNSFIKNAHPESGQRLELTGHLIQNLKKGSAAILDDFDKFQSGLADRAEKAAKALRE